MFKKIALLLMLGFFTLPCFAQTNTEVNNLKVDGAETVHLFNNIVYVDGNKYLCSDVGINAAITALGINGGTVDASACTSAGTIASTVIVGTNTSVNSHGVRLILPCTYAAWGITVTGGAHVFEIADTSELAGCANRASILSLENGADVADVISFIGNPADGGYTEYAKVSNVWVQNVGSATVTNGLLNLTGAFDSIVSSVKLAGAAPCLFYVSDNANPIGANADDIENVLLDGLYTAGTTLLCVNPTHGPYVGPLHFRGGDWGHPGTGKSNVTVSRGGTAHSFGMSFTDIYLESNQDVSSNVPVFSIADSLSPSFDNIYILRVGATSVAPGIYFNDTGSGATNNISIKNLSVVGGTTPNAVLSNIAGIPNLAVNLVPGLLAPGIGGLGFTLQSSLNGLSNISLTAPYTISGGTLNLPSASSSQGSQYQVIDEVSGFSEGATCSHSGSGAVVALAWSNGSVWKCF